MKDDPKVTAGKKKTKGFSINLGEDPLSGGTSKPHPENFDGNSM